MTPSTGLGLDGELSAPSSVGVGWHRWAKHTVRVNCQKNAQQPHSLLLQKGTCGHPGRSLDYVGRVVLGRRRVRVDVACSAGGRKEQGRDYPRSAGEPCMKNAFCIGPVSGANCKKTEIFGRVGVQLLQDGKARSGVRRACGLDCLIKELFESAGWALTPPSGGGRAQ